MANPTDNNQTSHGHGRVGGTPIEVHLKGVGATASGWFSILMQLKSDGDKSGVTAALAELELLGVQVTLHPRFMKTEPGWKNEGVSEKE